MRSLRSGPGAPERVKRTNAEGFAEELAELCRRLNRAESATKVDELTEELLVASSHFCEQLEAVDRIAKSTRTLQGRHEELFKFVREALFYTDRVGTIREVNPAGEELLQRERKFLLGKPLAVVISRDDVATFRRLLDSLRPEAPCEDEVEIQRYGGGVERVLLGANLTEAPHFILWAARSLEPGLVRRAHRSGTYRSPAAPRASAQLAARMNEQLDQSLHDALASVERLTDGRGDDAQYTALRLEKLLRSSVALSADLIELSRLSAGGVVPERARVDLSALIELTAAGVAAEASARGIRMCCNSRSNLELEGDHGRLAQVLLAVFIHSLRGADATDPITVTVHEGEGWAALKLRYLRRPGVSAPACEAFDWLRAADIPSLTARLSLSLARANAALHGGSLSFNVDAHGVASFVLRLPLIGSATG